MNDQPDAYWRCLNCGQVYFGTPPPDMCDFCKDFTTWKQQDMPSSSSGPASARNANGDRPQHQPRLFDD